MTATHRVHVTQTYSSDPATVFAAISEHENLGTVLPVKITRVRDGDTDRNGVGSIRSLRPLGILPPFQETISKVVPNERIEYFINKGGPLRDHSGLITFEPTASGGTKVDWTISFSAPVPGLAAVLQKGLTRTISKGLPRLIA